MNLTWIGVMVLAAVPAVFALGLAYIYWFVVHNFLEVILRIFQEKPLFVIPRGDADPGAEDVIFVTSDGLALRGCYLHTHLPRKGVILFGLEFGSSRWACRPYADALLQSGYDLFAFEPRNQGESDRTKDYEPLQWLTEYERIDTEAALTYLMARADADPRGVGFFGISKGASAGLFLATENPDIRCAATDGAFGIQSTMVPYMRKWVEIYSQRYLVQSMIPNWLYGSVAKLGIKKVEAARKVNFLDLERAMCRFKVPLLMIHGGGDTYIKVGMARELFRRARGPKDFWLVDKAKHNQALHVAGEEYARRVVDFFDRFLGDLPFTQPTPKSALRPEPRTPVRG